MKRAREITPIQKIQGPNLNPSDEKRARIVEVVQKSYFILHSEMYYEIFSQCSTHTYTPLLKCRLVSKEWNQLTDKFLENLINGKENLDHIAMLYREPSLLRFKTDPIPEGFYKQRLGFFNYLIESWARQGFVFSFDEGNSSFILITNCHYVMIETNTPIYQFILIRAFEQYLLSETFIDDMLDGKYKLINAVINFLTVIKHSTIGSELLLHLIENSYIYSIYSRDTWASSWWFVYELINKKLATFEQIRPFISHALSLDNSPKLQFLQDIIHLLKNCAVFELQAIAYLSKNVEYKNETITSLVNLLSIDKPEVTMLSLCLLNHFNDKNCFQTEQYAILVNHLGINSYEIDIWLLGLLDRIALDTPCFYSKITPQFVNTMLVGLNNLVYENGDFHTKLNLKGITISDFEALLCIFNALLLDECLKDHELQDKLERVVGLLKNILEKF